MKLADEYGCLIIMLVERKESNLDLQHEPRRDYEHLFVPLTLVANLPINLPGILQWWSSAKNVGGSLSLTTRWYSRSGNVPTQCPSAGLVCMETGTRIENQCHLFAGPDTIRFFLVQG